MKGDILLNKSYITNKICCFISDVIEDSKSLVRYVLNNF